MRMSNTELQRRQCLAAVDREVAKAVKLRKAKTVVVAPNIEQIESEGGLDDLLGSILKSAEEFGLPVVFALSRKKMGQASNTYCVSSTCLCALSGHVFAGLLWFVLPVINSICASIVGMCEGVSSNA